MTDQPTYRLEEVHGYSMRVVRVYHPEPHHRIPITSLSITAAGEIIAGPQVGLDIVQAVAAWVLENPEPGQ